MTLSTATRLAPTSRVEVRALDDRGVVVDMGAGRCWELNAVGFAMWQQLVEGKSLQEASETIAARYGIALEVSVRDVTELARSLIDAGLLKPSPGVPADPSGR